MMTVIDLARAIRERHNKPLKTPLKYIQLLVKLCDLFMHFFDIFFLLFKHREMVVVHPDADFLEDITGKLREVDTKERILDFRIRPKPHLAS